MAALAQEELSFDEDTLDTVQRFICIVNIESKFGTDTGTTFNGPFQYVSQTAQSFCPGLDWQNDPVDSARCALRVGVYGYGSHKKQGFRAWPAANSKCNTNSSMRQCFDTAVAQTFDMCKGSTARISVNSDGLRVVTIAVNQECPSTKFKIQRVNDNAPICHHLSNPKTNNRCEFVFDAFRIDLENTQVDIVISNDVNLQNFEVRWMKNDVIYKRVSLHSPVGWIPPEPAAESVSP